MLPVSFGAMLMESMLAIIALIAVASFADGEAAASDLRLSLRFSPGDCQLPDGGRTSVQPRVYPD